MLSLYSTRLVLDILTISDYGIYSVVAGIVSMLGYITNSLVITTQRYISFYHGSGSLKKVRTIFVNSLFLHIMLGIGICLLLFLLEDLFFDRMLNIDLLRIQTARQVYKVTVFMLFVTMLTAPFKALFIARENIVYISIVEVVDGVLKVVCAVLLFYTTFDKLLLYVLLLALILLLNLSAYIIYASIHFPECKLIIRRKDIDKGILKQLLGFAGWTTYGMGAIALRTQGISVIFNHFGGTVVNAAYGIAFQAYNAVAFVATSILNAMNPQIIKAEGSNNRERMLNLALMESKFSVMLLTIILLPIIVEMPSILSIWLKEVPEYAVMFCRFVFISFICDQLTIGLNVANQAQGNIRNYTLLMYTPKLLILPVAYLMMDNGGNVGSVMWLYVGVELFVALMRIPYIRHTMGLSVVRYLRNVLLPLLPLFGAMVMIGMACTTLVTVKYGYLITVAVSLVVGCLTAWVFTLSSKERTFVVDMVNKKIRRTK